MIKENTKFIMWSHHYFNKTLIGCRKRLFENNITTIYRPNYQIFDERYIAQKEEKKNEQ